jgi:hypothetical protein
MKRFLALAIVAFLLAARTCQAGLTLYIDDSGNRLGTVDTVTGAGSVIGTIVAISSGETITDIAFSPTGSLFAVSFNNLYSVNTTTGAGTLIGSHGLAGKNALVFSSSGLLYSASVQDSDLYTLNTSTGAATNRGSLGGYYSAGDLAFNGGSLYMSTSSNQLIRIGLDGSGNVSGLTLIGNLGVSGMFGLATGSDGVLYGVAGNTIYKVSTSTGAATAVVSYGGGLSAANGTSFFEEAQPVPEPATLTMFGIGALGFAGVALRRRKLAA